MSTDKAPTQSERLTNLENKVAEIHTVVNQISGFIQGMNTYLTEVHTFTSDLRDNVMPDFKHAVSTVSKGGLPALISALVGGMGRKGNSSGSVS